VQEEEVVSCHHVCCETDVSNWKVERQCGKIRAVWWDLKKVAVELETVMKLFINTIKEYEAGIPRQEKGLHW